MSINSRLNRIEEQLYKRGRAKGKVIIRWIGCDGYYPQMEADKDSNDTIVKIRVDGVSYEELKLWTV